MPQQLTQSINVAPDPISFRIADIPLGHQFPAGRYPFGKLLYSLSGHVELVINNLPVLSPPAYAIWIPPYVEHYANVREPVCYGALYVEANRCVELPEQPCALMLSTVFKAIAADFDQRQINVPHTPRDLRLADVLIDQLQVAPRFDSYVPLSNIPEIATIIAALQRQPGDRRSLAQWATTVGATERTLSRWWKVEMGVSFHEWRQRLKLTIALSWLDAGVSVEEIARQLGYGSASAFIAMFQQHMGTSPDRRRRLQQACTGPLKGAPGYAAEGVAKPRL